MDGHVETRPLPPPSPRRHPNDRRRGNALRHGLYGEEVVVAGEDADEYRRFRQSLLDVYAPRDEGEIWIVAGMAETLWRLKRTHRVEAELWDFGDMPDPQALWADVIESPTLRSALRVEGHLDRRFSRALLDLERHRRLMVRPSPHAPARDDEGRTAVDAMEEESDGAGLGLGAVDTSAPVAAPTAVEPPPAAMPATVAAFPGLPETDAPLPPSPPEREVEPPPADPATRAEFAAVARARRPVLHRAIDRLRAGTAESYRDALDMLDEAMRRWWEMRVTRAPNVRETWIDVSRRHPFWENNRTAGALRDWLEEVRDADARLIEEIEDERADRTSP